MKSAVMMSRGQGGVGADSGSSPASSDSTKARPSTFV